MKWYLLVLYIFQLWQLGLGCQQPKAMSKRTVLNEQYRGLVEAMSIPAEVHERDGKIFASFGGAVPIHCCTNEEVANHSVTTHHYCDIFTEQVLAPLAELAYVRIDADTAEKVFINRIKRLLLISSDGRLAQWRCAPTFESSNQYIAGTPIVSASGELLSLVTAKRGNHYAISSIDGVGGYFDTTTPWKTIVPPEGQAIYGDRSFPTREALRQYVASLPPGTGAPPQAPLDFTPVLHLAPAPRIALVASTGLQIAHNILQGVIVKDIEYL